MRQNLYIDIDGVILTRGGVPALHLDEFLTYILKKYSVFWLTTRCQGDNKYTLQYLSKFVPVETMTLLKKIRPTSFALDKTEAIDFGKKFFWLEAELFTSEELTLKKHNKYDSWIPINLMENSNQLLHLMNKKLNV